jgi:hypothetical protein
MRMAKSSLPGALSDAELYRLEQTVMDRIAAAMTLGEDTTTLVQVKRVIQEVKLRRDSRRRGRPESRT